MQCSPESPSPFSSSASAPPPQEGFTSLHFAASRGFLGMIDKLLDMGAKIDAKDREVPIR
jgi:ankyrin repeat protein